MNEKRGNKLNGVFLGVNIAIFIAILWTANTGWLASTTAEQWIAIATAVTALCAVLGLLSLFLLKRQFSDDHERSRREMGIELMKFWQTFHLNHDLPYVCARRLLGQLSPDQSHKVVNCKQFSVEKEHEDIALAFKKSISSILEGQGFANGVSNPLFFNEEESKMLLRYGNKFLNNLEIVATAWRYSVTDKTMIENGFEGILDSSDDRFLEHFLLAHDHYPSLKFMLDELKKKNKQTVTGKDPTGS